MVTARRLGWALITCGSVWLGGCASSSTPASQDPAQTTEEAEPTATDEQRGAPIRYRFNMRSPANDDFAVTDENTFILVRPRRDDLIFKVQGRNGNQVRVIWDRSEFTDIFGRRYRVVPATVALENAVRGVPPTDIPGTSLYSTTLTLLDPTQASTIQQLGGKASPIVPDEVTSPDAARGETFYFDLAIELNSQPQDYQFVFDIKDATY